LLKKKEDEKCSSISRKSAPMMIRQQQQPVSPSFPFPPIKLTRTKREGSIVWNEGCRIVNSTVFNRSDLPIIIQQQYNDDFPPPFSDMFTKEVARFPIFTFPQGKIGLQIMRNVRLDKISL